MKYLGKILITFGFFALVFLLSSPASLAQLDSIEVRTKECYWQNPWYVGADTVLSPSTPTFQTRYNPILKVWVINNQNKVDYVNSMKVHFEGDDLADVEEVWIYREAHNLPDAQADPWDTSFSYYPVARRDSSCLGGTFDIYGDKIFVFGALYPVDSTRFELPANDSVLYYVVFILPAGLGSGQTGNLLDCMIPQDGVVTKNDWRGPAQNEGELITDSVLVDATPPNLTEGDLNIWGDSAAVKLGVEFTDSVVALTDNVTQNLAQSNDDILLFVDIRSFGTAFENKRLQRVALTNDFIFRDSIEHEDKVDNGDLYGVDIEAYEALPGGGTPGSYIQRQEAWDEFGNSAVAWDLENDKPIDTIWPDSNLVEWLLHYDANGDGVAGIGDSIRIRVDARNQAPAGESDEIINKDVYHSLFPRNGMYFADRFDFRGFDPTGANYGPYPFEFADADADEMWNLYFEVKLGDWDVDSGDANGYVLVTAEDNAQYWPDPPWPAINYVGPGNTRRMQSELFPFGVDNFPPNISNFSYDLAPGGDLTCLNIVNIGDKVLFLADLRANLDSIAWATVDLFTNGLGGPTEAPLYDDGTHGDATAGDGIWSLEWTVPEPSPAWTWDTEEDGVHSCTLTVADDAGNMVWSAAFIGKLVDTEKPLPVYELAGQAMSGGRIHLSWRDSTKSYDKGFYYIYSNGGTGGIGNIDTTAEYARVTAPESTWTSDPLTHGLSYCFLIRNMDDACNMEYNYYNMICITADAEAPTAEFVTPEDGDIFGPAAAPIQVIVRSGASDIDWFKIYYREKDIDALTPGDQPGPWIFGVTIDNDGQYGSGSWDPTGVISGGVWEGVVCGMDEAGNQQTPSAAYTLGQTISIIWDAVAPVVTISSINGDYNPAGVILENGVNNICVIGIDQNWTNNMDVWMRLYDGARYDTLFQGWQDANDMTPTNPYCFDFSLAGWQGDNATLSVWIFDEAGNKGMASVSRPVQDIYPVVARMSRPVNFERVMWSSAYPVQAEFLAGSGVGEVVMVQFQESPHGADTWTTFCTQYSPVGNYFNCTWNNTAYVHGDQVDVRALFFDNAIPANVETTAFVTVTIDQEGPVVDLIIENAVDIDGVQKVGGTQLSLIVNYLADSLEVDIDSVIFWVKKCDQPDMYWTRLGYGTALYGSYLFPAGWSGYIGGWDTTCYEVKVVPWDASGNEGTVDIETFWYEKYAPQVAVSKVATGGMEFVNPSGYLMGSGKVYAQAGNDICFWHKIMTPWDSLDVDFVRYRYNDYDLGDVGLNDSVCFNPLAEGIIHQQDMETYGFYFDVVEVTLFDVLGNNTYDLTCTLGVLDVTGNEVVITTPGYNYVCGRVYLTAAAVNAYNLESVTYYYRAVGATDWIEIGTSTGSYFYLYWLTRNNVPDGWYELAATSKDRYGNISDFSRIRKVMVLNTPPIVWMNSPQNGAIVGAYMDITDGDADVRLEAFAKGPYPDAPAPAWIEFQASPLTSNYVYDIGSDWMTTVGDSLYSAMWYINPGWSGWYQVWAEGWDSSWCYKGYSDTVEVCIDDVAPYCEIVAINSEHNVWDGMDIGGPPYEDTLKARAFETEEEGEFCFSGLDSLQFMVYAGEDCDGPLVFFGSVYDPDPQTQYEMVWNNSGLAPGDYCFNVRAVDKVGNASTGDGIWLRIEDWSQRTATIRAFHDYSIVASVTGSADNVTIQYAPVGTNDWVSVGITEYIGDYLWSADWDPGSLPEGDYLARALAHGLWGTSTGPVVRFHVDAGGAVDPAETADIGAISFRAVLETGTKGVVKVEAARTPYLLAVYSHGDVEVERISLSKETGTNMYNGTFEIPWSYSTGGDVRFYASVVPDTTWIEMAGFDITEVERYLGTNGPVDFVDGSASIDVPGGAINVNQLNLVGYPTMMPAVVDNECKKFTPVGNADGLMWKWYLFGYSADANLYDYAKITLNYDETQVTVPESELQVARWDYDDYCWEFWGIESPTIDEANNTVTFFTDYLGAFAVVQTPVAMWASVEVDPNCSDYSNSMPCFVAHIHSDYAEVDDNSIKVTLGPVGGTMKTIYYDNHYADGYCSPFEWYWDEYDQMWYCDDYGWDDVSGELDVCVKADIKALAAGDHMIMVEAYDEVGNFASASYTFTVDNDAPVVYMTGGYVGSDPEFYFVARDTESGLDLKSIFVDLYAVTKQLKQDTAYTQHWVEVQAFLGTYNSDQLQMVNDTLFWVRPTLDLYNSQALDVVIHNGYCNDYRADKADYYEEGICIPPSGHGPADCVGNSANHAYQRFVIDAVGPTVTPTSMDARPIVFSIQDEAGVDWATFMIMEDGTDITGEDRVVVDEAAGTVTYTPADIGVAVNIAVEDMLGNKSSPSFTTEAKELAITDAHNYPNPFDDYTTIVFTLSRGGDVLVKIYDFAGELVKTLIPGDVKAAGEVTASWFGKNDEGEDVASGIYLCHIKVNDGSNTATETIKIAKVSRD